MSHSLIVIEHMLAGVQKQGCHGRAATAAECENAPEGVAQLLAQGAIDRDVVQQIHEPQRISNDAPCM